MTAIRTPAGPEPRLLLSLSAWSWPGNGPDDREIAHILITHSPAPALSGPADAPESRMRRLADSLGGLGRAVDVVLLGLDSLSQFADESRLDTYLDTASRSGRLLYGMARTR